MTANAGIRICICTHRPPNVVRPVLEAAALQAREAGAAAPLLIGSGLPAVFAAAHEQQAGEAGAEFIAAPAGAAAARNEALRLVTDDAVIAYLDDDVTLAPDWLERLTGHWTTASADVACIGGRVDPGWETPPPGWYGDELADVFALLDLGPGVIELDTRAGEGVWTANAAFRAGALRRAGGFPTSLGPWGSFPIIGEDTAVQRRLAELGGRVLYAGDVAVSHRISGERLSLRGLWLRELMRGFSQVRAGVTTPLRGAVRAPKAAAGTAVSLARRDERRAAERYARLARTFGAASAPLIARRLRRRGWPG